MGETFLVNINCTKLFGNSDVSQYTMFIDTSKMSIVYELVEWIRWMFSLDPCFYITHNNSIIHELEDIRVLSKLNNFELKPCGRAKCVHKKMYRTLLKNLNLFVSWNGLQVHRYFLHKLNQMDHRLMEKSNTGSLMMPTSSLNVHPAYTVSKSPQNFLTANDKKFDNTKNINPERNTERNLAEASMPVISKTTFVDKVEPKWEVNNEMNCFSNKKVKPIGNLSNPQDNMNEFGGENSKKRIKGSIMDTSPIKNTLKSVEESSKNCTKANSKKYIKPFSLGEILSNIREEYGKEKTESTVIKGSSSPSSVLLTDFDEKTASVENSFTTEIKSSGGKKRTRTRRRKKAKKDHVDEFTPQLLDKSTTDCSLDLPQSSASFKPNHIRFDSDKEDSLMETECLEDNLSNDNQTKCDDISKLSETNRFVKSGEEESVQMAADTELISEVNNIENNLSMATPFVAEQKLIEIHNQTSQSVNQSYSANGNLESKNTNPDLHMLLSLKEKFKNAVVFERFF